MTDPNIDQAKAAFNAAMQAEATKVKGWWSAHKVWAAISLACGVVGFVLAKIG